MKTFRCLACGHIHIGNEPPENCPVCGVSSDMFQLEESQQPIEVSREPQKFVIIGAGIAGVACAEEIRKNLEQADITLICQEALLPYYRLSLSRYLAGEINRESLIIHPQSFYDERRIKLIQGTEVTDILKDKNRVVLSDGREMGYDKLIVASGAYPFVPPIVGKELANVVTVRNLQDADFILQQIRNQESVICIGGGILGLEIAGAIAKSGVRVTVLEGLEWLMPRQLNKKGAEVLKGYLERIGITVRENVKIQEITGDSACTGVKLSTGEMLPTRLVIITAGIRPNIRVVKKAGLEVNSGLVVNSTMQTSQENIYAAGDVTECKGILYGIWNAAQAQGKVAAQNAAGRNARFEGVPKSAVLKVMGLDLFSIGEFIPKDESCILFEQEGPGKYTLILIRESRITGSIIIGDKALAVKVKQAVEKGSSFQHEQYRDIEQIIQELKRSGKVGET